MFHFVAPAAAAGGRLSRFVVMDGGGELADMFTGVVEFEDLSGAGEGQAAVLPNPCGSVAEIYDLFGTAQSAAVRFLMEQHGDLAAALVGAGVTGGAGITQGLAFLIAHGLGEDATEFGLTGAGAAVGLFAFGSFEFVAAHGSAGAIATDVEDRDRGGLRCCDGFKSGKGFA